MNFFKHRHIVVAALVAPVLALIAYFGMDYIFSETPQVAVEGQSYLLVEKPNCRYDSGFCGLKNNEFELDMSYRRLGGNRIMLDLESAFPLEGVMLAVVRDENDDQTPAPMNATGGDGTQWTMEIMVSDPEMQRIRLVASAGGAFYFGDVSTRFTLADLRAEKESG